ncbi:hypothetical protein VARIO8X_130026 [Burkholderiales bacterium 8X]|nr:hypothetical protein VARIO8X_130026 [Burkholderiales bacterium 8X]
MLAAKPVLHSGPMSLRAVFYFSYFWFPNSGGREASA